MPITRFVLPILALLATALLASAPAVLAATSHAGWPSITGVLIMNKEDQSRPIDARPGQDLFGGKDSSYSCDGVHKKRCAGKDGSVIRTGHNELLGGHGSDTITAGPQGDVIWGDYKPSGQPASQVDRLSGGNGNDFIYASHGTNVIRAGGGNDSVKAHFGKGIIDCGGGTDLLYVSRRAQKSYKISHCETVSHKSLGF
jgi:RTX calcium-binding nonapeptide repeat (4 copies)